MNTIGVLKGTKVYYTSAKFRELQLDYIMNNRDLPSFPVDRNFFVGQLTDSLAYGNLQDNVGKYFESSELDLDENIHLNRNFNITHVFLVKRDLNLINIMDYQTIEYLLFKDADSPYHISKSHQAIHDSEDPYNHIRNNRKAKSFIGEYTENMETIKYSAFLMLVAATGYYLGPGKLTRYSSTFFDYTMIELLADYVKTKKLQIDGWYQPYQPTFHEEYALFYPNETLQADYKDHASWTQHANIDAKRLTLKRKLKLQLDIVKKWRLESIKKIEQSIKEYQQQLNNFKKNSDSDSETDPDYLDYLSEYDLSNGPDSKRDYINHIQNIISELRREIDSIMTSPPPTQSIYRTLDSISKTDNPRMNYYLQRHYNRKTKTCNFNACEQPISFESQKCQQSLNQLANEMRLYPNANDLNHLGETIADHSIWVTRAMHRWLGYVDHPWTVGIDDSLRNVALISSFLHDIGKIGDRDVETLKETGLKKDHPYRGFQYILKRLDFRTVDKNTDQKLDNMLYNCHINSDFHRAIIATVIALHHHLGELLMTVDFLLPHHFGELKLDLPHVLKITLDQYFYHETIQYNRSILATVINSMIEYKYIIYYFDFLHHFKLAGGNINNKQQTMQALMIVLSVSAADVYGSHPVANNTEEYSIYEASLSQILDPQILHNITKRHKNNNYPEIFRGYYRYLYYTIGLRERHNLISYAKTVINPRNFLDAWYNFKDFIEHVNGNIAELPSVYNRLNYENIFPSLLRLLKTGEIDSTTPIIALNKKQREYLTEEIDEKAQRDIIKLYRTHRHKDLVKEAPELGVVPITMDEFTQSPHPKQYGVWKQAP